MRLVWSDVVAEIHDEPAGLPAAREQHVAVEGCACVRRARGGERLVAVQFIVAKMMITSKYLSEKFLRAMYHYN